MPFTMKQVWAEVTKLKLLGPTTNNEGIFVIEEDSCQQEELVVEATQDFLIAGRILPTSDIYKDGSYRLEMKLSSEYPFKPPQVRLTTPIHHINVDKDGE